MYLYNILGALGITSIMACSGFSGGDASDKFSGGGGGQSITSNSESNGNGNGDDQTSYPNGDGTNANTSTPGCSDGDRIDINYLSPEIKSCLESGYLYQFNKWSANGGTHKDEYCIKTGVSIDCSAESLIAKSQEILKRDKSNYIQGKFNDGYLPVSCATISNDRLIYQIVKRSEDGACSAKSGTSIITICDRFYQEENYDNENKTQADILREVNNCLDDPVGKIR